MAGESVGWSRTREVLSTAIVDVLKSWPELHQRVFIKSHYCSESIEQISISVGLRASEVRAVLDLCDRKLRGALKGFRQGAPEREDSLLHASTFASNGCFQ